MMQSTMVESVWENFYMLYSFIHTIKGNAVLFKGDMKKMDSLIKRLCVRMQNFACVGAFNFMHIVFLKLTKEQFHFCKYISQSKDMNTAFFVEKSAHFY